MCQNLKMLLHFPLIFVSFHLFAVVGGLPSFLSYTVIPPFAWTWGLWFERCHRISLFLQLIRFTCTSPLFEVLSWAGPSCVSNAIMVRREKFMLTNPVRCRFCCMYKTRLVSYILDALALFSIVNLHSLVQLGQTSSRSLYALRIEIYQPVSNRLWWICDGAS